MTYKAVPYIPHDELDDELQKHPNCKIHSVLPVRHTETTDCVTLILELHEIVGVNEMVGPCQHTDWISTNPGWVCRECGEQMTMDSIT